MNIRRLTVLLALLLCTARITAVGDSMPIVVQSDIIKIGTEFVPRCAPPQSILTVPAGTTFELLADATWDCLEVFGTLRVSRTHDTTLRVTHLFILPGGVLDAGTKADPVRRHVEVIIRNVPIDLTKDKFQWGNGLLNFGTQSRVGAAKTAWVEATGGLTKGSTAFTLATAPTGWQVGDELLIPDTHQPWREAPLLRETPVFIQSINGTVLNLSKPLDFDHLNITEPEGQVVARPRVANLTRNIVLRSENHDGTAGHTADVGHAAMSDIEYNQFVALGRTRNISLDLTQKGRYAYHAHHSMGLGSFFVGNVLTGHPDAPLLGADGITRVFGPKWGAVFHNVHDGTITDNVTVGFPGAGFVTEDGNETRNIFRHNLAAYSIGNHDGTPGAERTNIDIGNNPGGAGNGFFMRAVQNIWENNETWNSSIGFDLFTIDANTAALSFPSTPGGPSDTVLDLTTAIPIRFVGNKNFSNVITGDENWFVNDFPKVDLVAAYNGAFQFLQGTSNPARPHFVNPWIVGHGGTTHCIASSMAYAQAMNVTGGRVVGCEIGITSSGANHVTLSGVFFQNVLDIDMADVPVFTERINVTHKAMPGRPAQFEQFGRPEVWNGVLPLPTIGINQFRQQRGSAHTIVNYQGDGKSYRLMAEQQLGSATSWPSQNPPEKYAFGCPEYPLTMLACWMKYGLAFNGDTAAAAVRLDGLVTGFATEGLTNPLGPPRVILTSPTPRASPPTFIQDGSPNPMMRLYMLLTGDPAQAPGAIEVGVDDRPTFVLGPTAAESPLADDRTVTIEAPPEGSHVAHLWRLDANGARVSATTFSFPVGPVTGQPPPPPPPPPPSCVPPMLLLNGACVTPPLLCSPSQVLVNGVCVTPPPPTVEATSPDPTHGTRIVDAQGHVWTIDSGETRLDGVQMGGGLGTGYAWCGGALFVFGDDKNWYGWSGAAWALRGADDPCASPPPPPPPPICTDPTATNVGGPLPCVPPPPPPVCQAPNVIINGACVPPLPPPPPAPVFTWETIGSVLRVEQEKKDGVQTGRFRVCLGATCAEVKP